MAITNSPVTGTMKYLTIGENTYELAGSSGSGNGTVTSVGVSNATNGGLSISGSPITTSGSITIGHSNVLTNAQTTSGVYPIKIDKNGHISQYGSAITIPTKVSDLTNDSGFVTTDTKNTAGSTNSNSKLFLIGATEQNANPQTYSNSKLYYNTGLHSEAESNYYDNISTISQTSNSIKFDVFDESYDNVVLTMKNGAITLAGVDPSSSGFDPTNDYYLQYDAENNNMTIKGVVTPTADRDAANKAYVDSLPGLSSWAKASSKPSYTASQVGAAASDHVHGNITNGGDITATAPTVASGDQIIINDDSASKITNGPTFDGSTTTKALTPKGTWETFLQTDEKVKSTTLTAPGNSTKFYLTGSQSSSTSTGELVKFSSIQAGLNPTHNYLHVGDSNYKGALRLQAGNYIASIVPPSLTSDRTITLPNATGTVALTNNIPTKVSDLTNDSGFITTDSDEKLSVTEITSGTTTYYPILTTDSSTASTKKYDKTVQITRGQSNADFITKLKIGDSSSYIGGRLILTNETNNKDTTIVSSASSTDKTITLPDATGTVALISDLSSFVTHDTNVTQTNTTDSASYRILLSNSANDTTETAGARKGTGLQFNPSTKNLYVSTGTTNGNIYMRLSTSDSLYTVINELGWTSSVIE